MAEGLTDRGIGERLRLTQNTVETHIRRVHAVVAYLRSG
jgi:DNA-binding NarL/FixJ family response regulator